MLSKGVQTESWGAFAEGQFDVDEAGQRAGGLGALTVGSVQDEGGGRVGHGHGGVGDPPVGPPGGVAVHRVGAQPVQADEALPGDAVGELGAPLVVEIGRAHV